MNESDPTATSGTRPAQGSAGFCSGPEVSFAVPTSTAAGGGRERLPAVGTRDHDGAVVVDGAQVQVAARRDARRCHCIQGQWRTRDSCSRSRPPGSRCRHCIAKHISRPDRRRGRRGGNRSAGCRLRRSRWGGHRLDLPRRFRRRCRLARAARTGCRRKRDHKRSLWWPCTRMRSCRSCRSTRPGNRNCSCKAGLRRRLGWDQKTIDELRFFCAAAADADLRRDTLGSDGAMVSAVLVDGADLVAGQSGLTWHDCSPSSWHTLVGFSPFTHSTPSGAPGLPVQSFVSAHW